MNKAILFGIVIIALSSTVLQAKSDFRDGFIITAYKDTIFGKIDYRSDLRNGKVCIFKSDSGIKEYSPSQILGFGFVNDRYYSSQIIEGTFVEVLVQGVLSLYKNGYEFYVSKGDSGLFRLESKQVSDTVEVKNSGESYSVVGLREDVRWKGKLAFLTSDCVESYQNLQSLNLTKKDLTKFVVEYNLCKGNEFRDYNVTQSRYTINYGISAGLESSVLKFGNVTSQFNYLADKYQSYNPSAGLMLSFSSTRISKRLALQTELCYSKVSFYSQIVEEQPFVIGYYETYIDFRMVSVPISLRYTFPVGSYSLFLNGGVEIDFLDNNNSKVNKEILSGKVVDTYEYEPFVTNNSPMGYWGNIGILKSFKSFSLGATLKYYHTGNIISDKEIDSSLNRISVSIIISGR